ncbi:MAG: TlpA family protein disulfide reductase [Muribaculaceae bacterium]|nr:TlpA family protein disulfide reductase [Muribaculaceae bacterium]
MKNRILFLAIALALCVAVHFTSMATEKAHITVKAAEGVTPTELVISKDGTDPADSPYRTNLENGVFEIDIETDFIEPYGIIDWTQLINNGRTARLAQFLVEDGANITLTLFEDRIEAESTGLEHLALERMESLKMDTFKARAEEIKKIEDENAAAEMYEKLTKERNQWESDYYAQNPMIAFILDLDTRLLNFRFNDHRLMQKLQLYHDHYSDRYPGHPVHQSISKNENVGLQIYGGKYHDYDVRTIDGEKVRASDFLKPGYNLVVCWASWCSPCRKEAQEIAEFIDPYIEKGLNVFALTREFKNIDALKQALDKDQYPWQTLVDIDDEFHVFDRHGATSSAVFLINPEGKIIFSDTGSDKVKAILDTCFN